MKHVSTTPWSRGRGLVAKELRVFGVAAALRSLARIAWRRCSKYEALFLFSVELLLVSLLFVVVVVLLVYSFFFLWG